jgi:hypothetical protein
MLFAAEETALGFQRFASRHVDPAMRAGDHGLDRGRRGRSAALAYKAAHEEVEDGYRDEEK